jgi:hypothetical protein
VTSRHGSEPVEFDVFISHAYEDKDSFVRPLANALEARRLRPWYDEFTLRPGDSLRRSIDHGLLTSQAGIVVLSPAFFAKRWPAYELDGLVQLHAGTPEQVAGSEQPSRIIPIWHNVDAVTVTRFSPSLANLVAIMSSVGVEPVADRILNLLRPAGSTLLIAHAELSKLGEPHDWHPPLVTDDWWLDAVESSVRNDVEGTFQEPRVPALVNRLSRSAVEGNPATACSYARQPGRLVVSNVVSFAWVRGRPPRPIRHGPQEVASTLTTHRPGWAGPGAHSPDCGLMH